MIKYVSTSINRKMNLKTLKYPISVYLKLTTNCMLKCEFCSQAGKIIDEIKLKDAKKILDELHALGIVYIYYTGGEPLLYYAIKEILQYGYNLGFKQVLVTNGLLFAKKEMRDLSRYLVTVGISLHGNKEIHNMLSGNVDCFDVILNNIKILSKENPNIGININCTAVDKNISYSNFKYLADLCQQNNWKLTIARLNYIGNGETYQHIELDNMLSLINKLNLEGYDIKISNCIAPCTIDKKYRYLAHGCGAGQSIAAIESNCNVKICASSEKVIGNLKNKSFKSIWNNKDIKKLQSLKWLPIKCMECQDFNYCKGGCKSELTGDFGNKFCDKTVSHLFETEWNNIKNAKLSLAYGTIRKEKVGSYTILSIPTKSCNRKVMKVLMNIDGQRTGIELLELHKNKEKVKELSVALSLDGLIVTEK